MLFKQTFVAVEQFKTNKEVLAQILEAVRLIMRIFFSLNWQVIYFSVLGSGVLFGPIERGIGNSVIVKGHVVVQKVRIRNKCLHICERITRWYQVINLFRRYLPETEACISVHRAGLLFGGLFIRGMICWCAESCLLGAYRDRTCRLRRRGRSGPAGSAPFNWYAATKVLLQPKTHWQMERNFPNYVDTNVRA